MKALCAFNLLLFACFASAQSLFPDFLQGTWKVENRENYEHWDKLNDNTLKGLSYKMRNGRMLVSEYLDITASGDYVLYTASVLKQNKGQGVAFRLSRSGSTYTFENPSHDFPKKIVYELISNHEILVRVSDGDKRSFHYTMHKLGVSQNESDSSAANPQYDAALAEKLGADEYGNRNYLLVVLKTGVRQIEDKALVGQIFRGHLDNINRLSDEGTLLLAGPVGKNINSYRGLFVLNLTDVAEAEKLLQSDPAIREGLLIAEIYTWYGSAALPEYLPIADKVWKAKP